MGKSRKSTIRKFEFYETITDNGIESGYVRLANTQFHSDAVMDLSANSYRVFTYMKFRAKVMGTWSLPTFHRHPFQK